MILQALAAYYQRLIDEGTNIAPEGFERKEIPFLIVLDQEGNFKGLQDTRENEWGNKRGRAFTVPKSVKRTCNPSANLLWDNPSYVLGYPEDRPNVNTQHSLFIKAIKENIINPTNDEGINAVLTFLQNNDFSAIFSLPDWEEIAQKGLNLTFKIDNEDLLVCQHSCVIESLNNIQKSNIDKQMCLITGKQDVPAILHTSIKGVRNANPTGANIVSFQKNSGFDSYGKEQGYNAPVGQKTEFAYTTALNHLLAYNSTQKIQIGDATTVFWAEKKNEMENVFAEFFGWNTNVNYEQDYKQLLALFHSPEAGIKRPELNPSIKFFVLGFAPNAARISVRFWYAGTVGNIADNIYQHFDDLEIVKSEKDWHKIDIHSLLKSTALQEKESNAAPNLAGDIMKAILNGTPYPRTVISSVLTRIKAEQAQKDINGKPITNVNFTRAAIIKAILVREARYYKQNSKEVTLSLDINNNNTGYLLGRLFAVLEKTQERANPGINATIRDRYYSAASSTPIAAFPSLMKLKNYHIAKLDNKGEVIYMEKMIGEIISKLGADTSFPAYLNLQDQGRFAVGYYHQRQDFYTKKEISNEKEGE